MALPLPSNATSKLKGHDGPVLCCRFNTEGNYALTGGSDRSIRLWNPHKGTAIKTYTGHAQGVHDIAVVKDNSRFASCGGDQLVWLWDVEQGKALRKFRGHQAQVNSSAFNQDDSLLITGSYDKMLCVWDMRATRNDTPLQVFTDFTDSVTKVFFSKDMSQIIASSVDGCIRRYDIRKDSWLWIMWAIQLWT